MAAVGQPNPPAKSEVKQMATNKVQVFLRMEGEGKSGMRFGATTKEDGEICRSVFVRKTTFDKLGKPKAIAVTIEAVCFEDEGRIRFADDVRQRRCGRCHKWKDESRFYKNSTMISGLAHWCKECSNKATNKSRRRRAAERVVSLQADAGS